MPGKMMRFLVVFVTVLCGSVDLPAAETDPFLFARGDGVLNPSFEVWLANPEHPVYWNYSSRYEQFITRNTSDASEGRTSLQMKGFYERFDVKAYFEVNRETIAGMKFKFICDVKAQKGTQFRMNIAYPVKKGKNVERNWDVQSEKGYTKGNGQWQEHARAYTFPGDVAEPWFLLSLEHIGNQTRTPCLFDNVRVELVE